MFSLPVRDLKAAFGDRVRHAEPLARYTSARVGGPAEALLEAHTTDELAEMAFFMWQRGLPCLVLGSGSNVLVSDAGVRGVVLLNQARQIRFDEEGDPPTVWAESGANFGLLARQAATRGLAGLEWATGIPGTVGGAIVGNAGAHGRDMGGNLMVAEILHLNRLMSSHGDENIGDDYIDNDVLIAIAREDYFVGVGSTPDILKETWPVEQFAYEYRSSILKRKTLQAVVLVALLRLEKSTPQAVQGKMDEFAEHRRRTQPPGASIGSMFKNPPGDFAGRLIEAAGLKGMRIGDAQISPLHANFFVNCGKAAASEIYALISLAQRSVAERMGVKLELEIELVGDWNGTEAMVPMGTSGTSV
jgi:UDP-N-acetylmuramate dehydrogenase